MCDNFVKTKCIQEKKTVPERENFSLSRHVHIRRSATIGLKPMDATNLYEQVLVCVCGCMCVCVLVTSATKQFTQALQVQTPNALTPLK